MRLTCVIALLLCPAGLTAATLELARGQVGEILRATVETAHYPLTVDASNGARVMSLVDRPLLSAAKHTGRVVEQAQERIRLAFSVRNEDGIVPVKAFTFTEGRSDFTVAHEIENGPQLPFALWARNPGRCTIRGRDGPSPPPG